jgi:hypothetical protein
MVQMDYGLRKPWEPWKPWKPRQSRFVEADEEQGNNTEMDTYYNNYQVQRLLQAYGNWVRDYMDYGWQGYFLSFMFSQIPSSDASRMPEMKKHLGWFYGRLAKASVPKASSREWSEFLPKAVLGPVLN